jgi:two-component system KDP operon response regulator KdpE
MSARILVIDDDEGLLQLLRRQLELNGFQVLIARDGVKGLEILDERQPDLVLLDLMMPRMNGWEVCERIRETSGIPIIMLTALSSSQDTVRGLELGADGYLVKPVPLPELVARIHAALRRSEYQLQQDSIVRIDERLLLDRALCRVIVDGQPVPLSSLECKILSCFLNNPDRILTHQSLLTRVWGWEYADEIHYLKVYIYNLRQKIEKNPHEPEYILTERGLGYRFQMRGR